jgi:heme-degrading monooxygenase HmoA
MFLRISWGALKPGTWEDYEATHQRVVPGIGEVEGLRGRIVARDVDRPDTGYSISLWDSLEEMQSYEQGPLAAVMSELEGAPQAHSGDRHVDRRSRPRRSRGSSTAPSITSSR